MIARFGLPQPFPEGPYDHPPLQFHVIPYSCGWYIQNPLSRECNARTASFQELEFPKASCSYMVYTWPQVVTWEPFWALSIYYIATWRLWDYLATTNTVQLAHRLELLDKFPFAVLQGDEGLGSRVEGTPLNLQAPGPRGLGFRI